MKLRIFLTVEIGNVDFALRLFKDKVMLNVQPEGRTQPNNKIGVSELRNPEPIITDYHKIWLDWVIASALYDPARQNSKRSPQYVGPPPLGKWVNYYSRMVFSFFVTQIFARVPRQIKPQKRFPRSFIHSHSYKTASSFRFPPFYPQTPSKLQCRLKPFLHNSSVVQKRKTNPFQDGGQPPSWKVDRRSSPQRFHWSARNLT